MNKRIVLLTLSLFCAMHGMESCFVPLDIMPSIVARAIWLDEQDSLIAMQKEENASLGSCYYVKAIKRNYALQFVCKDFKRMFWSNFTEEEQDTIIRYMILIDKKRDYNYFANLTQSIQASPSFILLYPISDKQASLEYARKILPQCDASLINKVTSIKNRPQTTPLYCAARNRHVEMVKLLLVYPVIDVNETVPLYAAVRTRSLEIVTLLLQHPAIHINAVNGYGETALFGVVDTCWEDLNDLRSILDLLINAGIDASIKNNWDRAALDELSSEQRSEVVDVFKQAFRL